MIGWFFPSHFLKPRRGFFFLAAFISSSPSASSSVSAPEKTCCVYDTASGSTVWTKFDPLGLAATEGDVDQALNQAISELPPVMRFLVKFIKMDKALSRGMKSQSQAAQKAEATGDAVAQAETAKNFATTLLSDAAVVATMRGIAVAGGGPPEQEEQSPSGPSASDTSEENADNGYSDPSDKESLFHKGELNEGKVDPQRPLSTGTDRESVENLDRAGDVHQFDVPKDKMRQWEQDGAMERRRDYDYDTGTENEERRFYPPATEELDDFKVE